MKNKSLKLVFILLMLSLLAACGKKVEETTTNPMQYIE